MRSLVLPQPAVRCSGDDRCPPRRRLDVGDREGGGRVRVRSGAFTFLAVWLTMSWQALVRVPVRLPRPYYRLRPWELSGRGLPAASSRTLPSRRAPRTVRAAQAHAAAADSPHRSGPPRSGATDADAETAHALLFVLISGWALHGAIRGWWAAAGWTLLFNGVINGDPVLLQRYNRAHLAVRVACSEGSTAD